MAMGVGWMLCQALMPAVIGAAIDRGVTARDTSALVGWAGALLALGAGQAIFGILRHRCAVYNYLSAAYRTVQLTVRHAGQLGATLPRRASTGTL